MEEVKGLSEAMAAVAEWKEWNEGFDVDVTFAKGGGSMDFVKARMVYWLRRYEVTRFFHAEDFLDDPEECLDWMKQELSKAIREDVLCGNARSADAR